jgi:hypothetical protein
MTEVIVRSFTIVKNWLQRRAEPTRTIILSLTLVHTRAFYQHRLLNPSLLPVLVALPFVKLRSVVKQAVLHYLLARLRSSYYYKYLTVF